MFLALGERKMPGLQTFNSAIGPYIVVDTGIIIEFFAGSENGVKIKEMIFSNPYIVSIFITPLTIIEVYYIIRRKNSKEDAISIIDKIKKLTKIVSIDDFLELIGEIKSSTPFSLTDCTNIALAEKKDVKVLFKHETEIDKLIEGSKNLQFTSKLVFIDDFSYFNQ